MGDQNQRQAQAGRDENPNNDPSKPGYDPSLPQNTPKESGRPTDKADTEAMNVDDTSGVTRRPGT